MKPKPPHQSEPPPATAVKVLHAVIGASWDRMQAMRQRLQLPIHAREALAHALRGRLNSDESPS